MEDCTEYWRIQRMAQPAARCGGCQQKKEKKRSQEYIAADFLNETFKPYVRKVFTGNPIQLEREFFNSLSNLCRLYGLEEWDYAGFQFPLNISTAYKETCKRLESIDSALSLAIVSDSNRVTVATYRELTNAYYLYFVPFRPLFSLLKQPEYADLSALLLSVYAYLYGVIRIPSFGNTYSYMRSVYETLLEEYIGCATDYEEDMSRYVRSIKNALFYVGGIEKKIRGSRHLLAFEERLDRYVPKTDVEREIKEAAIGLYGLYRKYPQRAMSDNLNTGFLDPDAECTIYLDEYLSFVWDTKDWVIEDIVRYINSDCQEATSEVAPCSVQLFHEPQYKEIIDLSFEQNVFRLINDLTEAFSNF